MTDDDVTLGEVYRLVKALTDTVGGIRADAVLRAEYEQRLTGIDREMRDSKQKHDKDIADLKADHEKDLAEIKAARTTPPAWAITLAGLAAGGSCVISTIALIAHH